MSAPAPFSGLAKARTLAERVPFFPPHFQGLVIIKHCKLWDGDNGQAFIVEFEVKSTNLPDVRVGERRSWYVKMGTPKEREMADPNIKQFAFAALEARTEADKARLEPHLNELMLAACSEEQGMTDTVVQLNTMMNRAGTFTKHYFAIAS